MKKTLVALALATTTVSGSAMAWTANGTGGSLELRGTLSPLANVNPWEVLVGAAVANLNAQIDKGVKTVDVPVKNAIPVLGIRTQTNQAFPGAPGIAPMIDFKGAIDPTKFVQGVTPLTLDVKDSTDTKIGTLTTDFGSAAQGSVTGIPNFTDRYTQMTSSATQVAAFNGGLGTDSNAAFLGSAGQAFLNNLSPEFLANIDPQGMTFDETTSFSADFDTSYGFYSAAYGSGIEAGKVMKLTLDAPATGNAIVWKASMPITVSYQ
ncbi:TPA: hypothetical protein PNO53_002135 [Salmonella enterica]|nr:hypothetical protein [Salmonella enterica]